MKHVKKSVLLWYSAHEIYGLVTDVEAYPQFLPWCSRVEVLQRDEQGLTRMKSLSGEDRAPVLALGEKIIVKGYSEPRWQAALDEAGYPKTPPQRRSAVGGATGASRDVSPAAPVEGARPVTPQQKGGDYPKQ